MPDATESPQERPLGHLYPMRVQWEDTDAAGIVYYANYLRFAERGRSDVLLSQGVSQDRLLQEQKIAFAVRACAIEYLKPARLHDDLVVATRLKAARGATLVLDQAVWRGADKLAVAEVTLACMGLEGRPRRIPAAITALFATLSTNSSQSSGTQTEKE
ncbi:YbgC/FadM family acyl-CoA thioesterase [Ferrovibrio sp.]|uniref:YbgC/FadM family acyl-CoA thioesterase n=1 Tax=Ferrovibrio sp. TaxID=1917215 RepID=UPI003D124D75